ncbi:Phage late control gene D protein (plasmid) [Caballeronia sp. SBC1]|uniref:contractile injection system protein, VgrG/Pvc8 family n=1 Tax=unclassified Caballeronia TaxID=2646786 RepID=UPI0013E145D4|nr:MULTISPECIES: contractile injection system protein, VgrG/Pvc8 family [unclassified Caballeronia]QIE25980.1 Phage late control gene D protein [Caballeronia sp. SBC2]QIN64707.1 Phage late control gene D protein [Caballeronia sp. SBC1]
MLTFSNHRTVTVSVPALPVSPTDEPVLQLSAIDARENLSEIYTYALDCLTPLTLQMLDQWATNLDIKAMSGKELTVAVQFDGMSSFVAAASGMSGAANIGQGTGEISDVVNEASFEGQFTRQCRYKLKMLPWSFLAAQKSDSRIFQKKASVGSTFANIGD